MARLGASDDCGVAGAETLPVTAGTVAGPGARELWPSGDRIDFRVSDKRGGTQTFPRRSPPFAFSVAFACRFTGEPGGTRGELLVGGLNATIE